MSPSCLTHVWFSDYLFLPPIHTRRNLAPAVSEIRTKFSSTKEDVDLWLLLCEYEKT